MECCRCSFVGAVLSVECCRCSFVGGVLLV